MRDNDRVGGEGMNSATAAYTVKPSVVAATLVVSACTVRRMCALGELGGGASRKTGLRGWRNALHGRRRSAQRERRRARWRVRRCARAGAQHDATLSL